MSHRSTNYTQTLNIAKQPKVDWTETMQFNEPNFEDVEELHHREPEEDDEDDKYEIPEEKKRYQKRKKN